MNVPAVKTKFMNLRIICRPTPHPLALLLIDAFQIRSCSYNLRHLQTMSNIKKSIAIDEPQL